MDVGGGGQCGGVMVRGVGKWLWRGVVVRWCLGGVVTVGGFGERCGKIGVVKLGDKMWGGMQQGEGFGEWGFRWLGQVGGGGRGEEAVERGSNEVD